MKKRGFTLIELLAVIVILAIIALIATPIVMNVIENSRKGAAERSAENYLRAVETAIATERLDSQVEDGNYTIDSDGNLNLNATKIVVEISGNKPNEGSKIIIENNAISDCELVFDNYIFTGKIGALQIFDGIYIETDEQLYALQRILLTKTLRAAKGYTEQSYEKDFKLFNIPDTYDTIEKKIEYLRSATFNLKEDLTVTFTRMDADNQFMAIGTTEYPFTGTFNGNNHTINLAGGQLKLNNNFDGNFGLFGYVENASINNLKLNVTSDLLVTQSTQTINFGLLAGTIKDSNIYNISLTIQNNATVGVDYQGATHRRLAKVGGLISESQNNTIDKVTINLNNSSLVNNNNSEDNYEYRLGGVINLSTNDSLSNINVELNQSSITSESLQSKQTFVGGISAVAKSVISNSSVVLKNSSIGGNVDTGLGATDYANVSVGGIIGLGSAGSNNTENIGRNGVTIDNCEVIIENEVAQDSIYAIEDTGKGVNAGGIAGIAYNNASILNSSVNIKNGNILASRTTISDTYSALGSHSGGVIGRIEHTGRIYNTHVTGDNLTIKSKGGEQYNYAGGIAGIDMGPYHYDRVSIENCSFNGNNNSSIQLELMSNDNLIVKHSYAGGIAGESTYTSKNNKVQNVNINITGINSNSTDIYAGDLFGAFNKTRLWTKEDYFTINTTRGLIDTTSQGVTTSVDNDVAKINEKNQCGYFNEYK